MRSRASHQHKLDKAVKLKRINKLILKTGENRSAGCTTLRITYKTYTSDNRLNKGVHLLRVG